MFGLKENHKTLFDNVSLFIGDGINSASIEKYTTVEKGHGRIEKRICQKATDIDWLSDQQEWAGLRSVFAIRRTVTIKGKTTDETCYYITSADATAEELLRIVREHWKIESLHWVLDVVVSEDECALLSENAHKTLNVLRKLAFLLHKQYIGKLSRKISVKSSLLNCLMSDIALRSLLSSL